MINLNRLSETAQDIILTLFDKGTATAKDFKVLQSKRKAKGYNNWGNSLLTESHKDCGSNCSLIHRGIIYVHAPRGQKTGRVFALTGHGRYLASVASKLLREHREREDAACMRSCACHHDVFCKSS